MNNLFPSKFLFFFAAFFLVFSFVNTSQVHAVVDCETVVAGDIVQVEGFPALYYINKDKKLMYFPHASVYESWGYDSKTPIKKIDGLCVDTFQINQEQPGVNYRSGSTLVKRAISPEVYAVLPGNRLQRIADADAAKEQYGKEWTSRIVDIPETFWANYLIVDDPIEAGQGPHDGRIVQILNDDGSLTDHYVYNRFSEEVTELKKFTSFADSVKIDDYNQIFDHRMTIDYGGVGKLTLGEGEEWLNAFLDPAQDRYKVTHLRSKIIEEKVVIEKKTNTYRIKEASCGDDPRCFNQEFETCTVREKRIDEGVNVVAEREYKLFGLLDGKCEVNILYTDYVANPGFVGRSMNCFVNPANSFNGEIDDAINSILNGGNSHNCTGNLVGYFDFVKHD